MRKRGKIPSGVSRKVFRNGAMRVHPKNGIGSAPMRGGIRL